MNEPVTYSVYEIVTRTLKNTDRNTFIHRIIYCGDHMFGDKSQITIQDAMEKIINTVNSEFCFERLTGLFLYYPNYFVHIIDGSEDSLQNHFKMLMTDYEIYLGRLKILVTYHHINQRFFNIWASRTAKPPTLLEKINPASDVEETFRYVDICIQKMYNLSIQLRNPMDEVISILPIQDTMMENLPEYSLLDFLLNSKYIEDLRTYIELYLKVPDMLFTDGQVWPVRMDFVPQDVFDTEEIFVPDLPKN